MRQHDPRLSQHAAQYMETRRRSVTAKRVNFDVVTDAVAIAYGHARVVELTFEMNSHAVSDLLPVPHLYSMRAPGWFKPYRDSRIAM